MRKVKPKIKIKNGIKEIYYTSNNLLVDTLNLINEGASRWNEMEESQLERILEAYEFVLIKHMQEATEDTKIILSPFISGLKIDSFYIPETIRKMYGEPVEAKARFGCKAHFSRFFSQTFMNKFRNCNISF